MQMQKLVLVKWMTVGLPSRHDRRTAVVAYSTPLLLLLPCLLTLDSCVIATCCFLLGCAATAVPLRGARGTAVPAPAASTCTAAAEPAEPWLDPQALLDARQIPRSVTSVPELGAFGCPEQWHLICHVDRGRARVLRGLDVRDPLEAASSGTTTSGTSGEFALRVVSQLECGVDELLSLVVELDLMPSWNRFCAFAAVMHAVTCVDLYAGGAARLPWPIPRYALLLRARLLDMMGSLGCMVVAARTPPGGSFARETPPHEAELPAQLRGTKVLPLSAVCALTPVGRRLSFDLVVFVRLNAAVAAVPPSLIDLVMRRVVPWLCRRVLALVEEIVARPDSQFRRRMAADATGVYAHIRAAVARAAPEGEVARVALDGGGRSGGSDNCAAVKLIPDYFAPPTMGRVQECYVTR